MKPFTAVDETILATLPKNYSYAILATESKQLDADADGEAEAEEAEDEELAVAAVSPMKRQKSVTKEEVVAEVAPLVTEWPCTHCNTFYTTRRALTRHFKTPSHVAAVTTKQSMNTAAKRSRPMEKLKAQPKRTSTSVVESPPVKKTRMALECPTCGETFPSRIGLANHSRTHRTSSPPLVEIAMDDEEDEEPDT